MTFNTVLNLELIDLDVEADISPAEKQTHDYPGCDASAQITSITFRGHEIPLKLFKRKELAEYEDSVLEAYIEGERESREAHESEAADRAIDERKERKLNGGVV